MKIPYYDLGVVLEKGDCEILRALSEVERFDAETLIRLYNLDLIDIEALCEEFEDAIKEHFSDEAVEQSEYGCAIEAEERAMAREWETSGLRY